jgi:hypothetical protein
MSNSVAALSERLQQQLKNDQQAVSNQTEALLEKHAEGLRKLSDDALTTTKTAIKSQRLVLDDLHALTLRRIRWLMLWPLLASAGLSLLMLASAGAWSWWKLSQMDDQIQRKAEHLQRLDAEFCASPVGLRLCKPKG